MIQVDLVRIVTTAGTTYYNPRDPVLTKAGVSPDGRQLYSIQPANQLKPGQQVAWDKQYVNVTLEQIADSLTTEPTYAAARAAIFLTNGKGELVPRFRELLINGLYQWARKNGNKDLVFLTKMSEKQLAQNIGKEVPDFSSREYGLMAAEVHRYVSTYNEIEGLPTVTVDAIRKWLKGETIGPRDKAIFTSLEELNPEFKAFTQEVPGERNLWEQYKIWVVVRQGLRNYFASVKAGGNGKGVNEDELVSEGNKRIRLTPFLKHVLDRFYQEVSLQHVNVLVTGVKPVHMQASDFSHLEETLAGMDTNGPVPHLYKGLCRDIPPGMDAIVLPRDSILNARLLVADAVEFGLVKYLRTTDVRSRVQAIIDRFGANFGGQLLAPEDFLRIALVGYLTGGQRAKDLIKGQADSKIRDAQAIQAIGDMLLEDAYEGKVDGLLRLPHGTFAAATDTQENIERLLPNEYLALDFNRHQIAHLERQLEEFEREKSDYKPKGMIDRLFINRLILSDIEKERAKVSAMIEKLKAENHDLQSRLDFDYDATQKHTLEFHATAVASLMNLPIEQILNNEQGMQTLAYHAIKKGQRDNLITYDEARRLFSRIGLPKSFLDLIPKSVFIDKIKISGAVRQAYRAQERMEKSGAPPPQPQPI